MAQPFEPEDLKVKRYAAHVVNCCDSHDSPEEKLRAVWMLAAAVARTIPDMTAARFMFSMWKAEEGLRKETGNER